MITTEELYRTRAMRLRCDGLAHRAKNPRRKNIYQRAAQKFHEAYYLLKEARRRQS